MWHRNWPVCTPPWPLDGNSHALGWLHLDQTLGRAAQATGTVVMMGAIVWAATVIRRRPLDELT